MIHKRRGAKRRVGLDVGVGAPSHWCGLWGGGATPGQYHICLYMKMRELTLPCAIRNGVFPK